VVGVLVLTVASRIYEVPRSQLGDDGAVLVLLLGAFILHIPWLVTAVVLSIIPSSLALSDLHTTSPGPALLAWALGTFFCYTSEYCSRCPPPPCPGATPRFAFSPTRGKAPFLSFPIFKNLKPQFQESVKNSAMPPAPSRTAGSERRASHLNRLAFAKGVAARMAYECRLRAVEKQLAHQTHAADEQRQRATQLQASLTRAEADASCTNRVMNRLCHEIRTPLNGCLAFTEMLLETPLLVRAVGGGGKWSARQCAIPASLRRSTKGRQWDEATIRLTACLPANCCARTCLPVWSDDVPNRDGPAQLPEIGCSWSYFACRTGHLVPM
jgi:hypothetical protein